MRGSHDLGSYGFNGASGIIPATQLAEFKSIKVDDIGETDLSIKEFGRPSFYRRLSNEVEPQVDDYFHGQKHFEYKKSYP